MQQKRKENESMIHYYRQGLILIAIPNTAAHYCIIQPQFNCTMRLRGVTIPPLQTYHLSSDPSIHQSNSSRCCPSPIDLYIFYYKSSFVSGRTMTRTRTRTRNTIMLYPSCLAAAVAVCVILFISVILTEAAETANTATKRRMPYLREKDLANYLSPPTTAGGAGGSNNKNNNHNNEKTKTNTVGDWMSISETVEFMPNKNLPPLRNKNKKIPPHLRQPSRPSRNLDQNYHYEASDNAEEPTTGAWDETDPYSIQPFVEGLGDYDEYQQAWRLLGFMIDCNTVTTDDDASGSGSEETTEEGCTRYVLWAAVRDVDVHGLFY